MTPPKRVSQVSDAHLNCRIIGHGWRYLDAWKEGKGFRQTLRCPGCKTVREDKIASNGDVISKKYKYADGYLLSDAGLGGARFTSRDRSKLRLRLVEIKINE
jgi:hypothetical protein